MNKRRTLLFAVDTLIIVLIYLGIVVLSNISISSLLLYGELSLIKFAVLYLLILFFRLCFKVHKYIWRYANVNTYLKLIISDTLAMLVYIALSYITDLFYIGIGYTVLFFSSVIILTLVSRLLYQVLYMKTNQTLEQKSFSNEEHCNNKINIGIVGAGNIGASLADELRRNPMSHYKPYCFIDIDKNKVGNNINSIPVLQADDNIIDTIKSLPIQEIVIAIPDASIEEKSRLYDIYKNSGCKVKIYDYIINYDGTPQGRRTLREFSIEDLLFRESLSINSDKTRSYYADKTILVTGGGGSIGSELCRQVAGLGPKKLVIFDIYENNAYEIQQELLAKYHDSLKLDTIIGSVRDIKRLDQVFREVRPDIVFHAAAHKHVPLMERSSCEAIKNNVVGTYNTANAAEKYGVKKFVLISTDKAVNPTNVMGASKRLCEMIIMCRKDSKCDFTAVRFGNVLGSNGSVIPLFKKQISAGGPVTITDKRITRYFMTIKEAVSLVMETGAMAHNGELFVLDMGKPVKILDLAENMIKLSGFTPYKDIDIIEVGLRPGEKLYEELLMKTEELDKTENNLIFIERDKPLSRDEVEDKIKLLLAAVESESHSSIIDAIAKTVPTYCDPKKLNALAIEKEMQKRTCSNIEEGESV